MQLSSTLGQDFSLATDERRMKAVHRDEEGTDQRHPAVELRAFKLIGVGGVSGTSAQTGDFCLICICMHLD